MFKIENAEATLAQYKPHTTKDGGEVEPIAMLRFIIRGLNTNLNKFDKRLLDFLYMPDPESKQKDLDAEFKPLRKFPEIKKFEWCYYGIGYRVTVHAELDHQEDINLIQCETKEILLKFEDDGIVEIQIDMECPMTKEESGFFFEHQKQVLTISMEPPTAEQQAQMELDAAA